MAEINEFFDNRTIIECCIFFMNYIIFDFILPNLYLGVIIFLIGAIIKIKLFAKKLSVMQNLICVIILFIIANLLSLMIWRFWPFDFDFMFGPISMPALISEIIVILLIYIVLY